MAVAGARSAKELTLPSPKEEGAEYRQPPHNLEAEQALLGAILINNAALHQVGDYLIPDHFYEPVHQRIFSAIQKFHDKGLIANPVTLKHFFEADEALSDIGGGEYLARLAGSAVTVINIGDYSQTIYDLALKRSLINIGENVVNTAFSQKINLPASEQIEEAEQHLFQLASQGSSERSFQPFRTSLIAAIQHAEAAYKTRDQVIGVSTGLADINKMLGGLQKSDLVILAGRPSMGKTALATTIAYNSAKFFQEEAQKKPGEKIRSVGFFSLEMSSEQLATRVLANVTSIASTKLTRGDLANEDFANLVRASQELSNLPLYLDDTPALSISALRTRARRLKRVHNLGMLVVDYLQLVRGHASLEQHNRVQEVSEITQGLKAIAKELDIPVMALSQLSRAVEQRDDKRPQLSDLRESGSIEQDADIVLFVFREEYYLERKKPSETEEDKFIAWRAEMERVHGKAEVIIAKHRNGPVGTVELQFNGSVTRFSDLTSDDYLPERRF